MSLHKFIVLSVTLAGREDGGLNVSSQDLPGLILSGSNREQIAGAIAPTIKAILERRGFREVRVHHGTPLTEASKPEAAQDVDVDVHVAHTGIQTEQFVVEVETLAA